MKCVDMFNKRRIGSDALLEAAAQVFHRCVGMTSATVLVATLSELLGRDAK